MAVTFVGVATAQSGDDPSTLETNRAAPLFDVSPIYKTGVTRLVRADGSLVTFSRSSDGQALLKLATDEEVWALFKTRGAANAEIFKTDTDKLMLRLTDRGNLSLHTPHYPGEPLSVDGALSDAFPDPSREPSDFENRLAAFLSLRVGRLVSLDLDESNAAKIWVHDAAKLAVKGIVKAKEHANDVTQVRVVAGRFQELNLSDDGTLTVTVNPQKKYFGRPSSDKIVQFLRARFSS